MKATQLLRSQHREVRQLFREATSGNGDRRRVMDEIDEKLRLHAALEEEIFYPALREMNKKAGEAVDEALEEHHVVKLVLDELPRVDPEDERFEAKMTVLSELVKHHVDEEESEMFKLAEKLDRDALNQLGRRMEERAGELERESGSERSGAPA